MDTSKTYIEQCRKAKELQAGWLSRDDLQGSVYSYVDNSGDGRVVMYIDESESIRDYASPVWLPRQDQLQKMVNLSIKAGFIWLQNFVEGEFGNLYDHLDDYDSWEQLWLAFVMYTNYKKVWDDDKQDWTVESKAK